MSTKKLTSYRFLQYLHLLWDIAFEISKVSLVFQRNEVAVSDVKHELDRVDLALHNMARRGGRHLQSFQEKVGDGVVFQDVNLKRAENDTETFARNRENILSDSRRFVQQRFESFCSPVLKAAAVITDHNSWPRTRDQLGMYGEEDVVVLANHYRDVLNRNDFDINEATTCLEYQGHGNPDKASFLESNIQCKPCTVLTCAHARGNKLYHGCFILLL